MIMTRLEDKDKNVCGRRLREGYEFLKSMTHENLAASQAGAVG